MNSLLSSPTARPEGNSPRHRRLVVAWVAATVMVVVGLPVPTAAQTGEGDSPASMVVFHLEGEDETEDLRDELTEVMRNKVAGSAKYELVNDEPVVYSDVVVVLGCSDATSNTDCLRRAAEHFDAELLLFGRIESGEGRNHVSVRMFDPERGRYVQSFGRVLAELEEPYPSFQREVDQLLGLDESGTTAGARSSSGDGGAKTAALEISTSRPGAVVRIDGERVGRTPVVAEDLEPGPHGIEVVREGYETWTSRVELASGDEVSLTAPLVEASGENATERAGAEGPPTSTEASSGDSAVTTSGDADPGPGESMPSSASRQGFAQWGPWVSVGAGGVAVVGGVLYGARVKSTEDELREWRASNPSPSAQCVGRECELIAQGERAETASRVLLGAGGAAMAGGLLWYFLQKMSSGGGQRAESGGVRLRPGLGAVTIDW